MRTLFSAHVPTSEALYSKTGIFIGTIVHVLFILNLVPILLYISDVVRTYLKNQMLIRCALNFIAHALIIQELISVH